MSQNKSKLAIGLGATCSGCDMSIVDLAEKIVNIFKSFEIVFWPTAQDQKLEQLKNMPDGSIDVALYHGSIANTENSEMAKLLRKKSKVIIAFGACATHGGIPGLANLTNTKSLFKTVYSETQSTANQNMTVPLTKTELKGHTLTLPRKLDTVVLLNEIIDVDYYLPGCPPETTLVEKAVETLTSGDLPPKGSVLAPERILCDECARSRSDKKISKIHRHHEVNTDLEKCLLEQGVICLGIATRAGCGAKCINANVPCRGCMGPTSKTLDQAAKAISSLASIIGIEQEEQMTEEEAGKLIDQIKDPLGILEMFTLPSSILRKSVRVGE